MSDTPQPEPKPVSDPSNSHTYDGIQEYDNPTPGWWNWLFIASIVFAPCYIFWFHAAGGSRTLHAQFERNLAANMELKFGELGTLNANQETLLRFIDDEQWLSVGKSTFATNCASCHGEQGEGRSAPNLTDDSYIHVNQIGDIANVVQKGAKGGAMPAWEGRLHPTAIVLVSSYVASLRGENLPSGRPKEGKVIPPWPIPGTSESSGNSQQPDDSETTDPKSSTTVQGDSTE
jgi:cytochrome c oxidase cbb3-type subunit 3